MGLLSNLKEKIQKIQADLEKSKQEYQAALYPKTFKLKDIIFADSTVQPINVDGVDTQLDLVGNLKNLFERGKFEDSSISISSIDSRGTLPIGTPVPISEVARDNLVAIMGNEAFGAMGVDENTLGFYLTEGLSKPEKKKILVDSGIDIGRHPTATNLIAIRDRKAEFDYDLIDTQSGPIQAPVGAFKTVAHELTHAASSFEYDRTRALAEDLLLHHVGTLRHHISTAAPGSMTFDDPVVVRAMDAARGVVTRSALEEVTAQMGAVAFGQRAGVPVARSALLTGYHSPSGFVSYAEGPVGSLSEQIIEMVRSGLIVRPDGSRYGPEDSAFFTSHIAQELQMQGAAVYNAGMLKSLSYTGRNAAYEAVESEILRIETGNTDTGIPFPGLMSKTKEILEGKNPTVPDDIGRIVEIVPNKPVVAASVATSATASVTTAARAAPTAARTLGGSPSATKRNLHAAAEVASAVSTGTKASKGIGARAVKLLRGTNFGRLFR